MPKFGHKIRLDVRFEIFNDKLRKLRCWRLYWFRVPPGSSRPGLILFPWSPCRLACGLAGILDIHRGVAPVSESTLASLAQVILEKPLDLASDGRGGEEFLGGWAALNSLREAVQARRCGPGLQALLADGEAEEEARRLADQLSTFIEGQEAGLSRVADQLPSAALEEYQRRLVRLKDAAWTLGCEVLRAVDGVRELGADARLTGDRVLELYRIHNTLENLNRLEIRGRDSAGLSLIFSYPGDSWDQVQRRVVGNGKESQLSSRLEARFSSGAMVMRPPKNGRPGSVTVGWRVAAEIGKLGENVNFLRREIRTDGLLADLLDTAYSDLTVTAHTRWASNGIINLPNCHPLDNLSLSESDNGYEPPEATIHVVLNGDIDNYESLRTSFEAFSGRRIEPQVTTDAKIIALEVERNYLEVGDLQEAFRLACSAFDGSSAIAMHSDLEPGKVFLSLKGSGQALYIGLLQDGGYVYASEVYGLVGQTSRYLAMDGEAGGQVVVLDAHSEGGLAGIRALQHDGTAITLSVESNIRQAQITTRDIDREDYEHYFLKEIHQSPISVEKTLRGKFTIEDGEPVFNFGDEILPERLSDRLTSGSIRKILLIGQGTAAVAAEAIALFFCEYLGGSGPVISALKASELSGFHLRPSMEDTLVICVTQSGTTTDTNRAVEMVCARGAATMAIVNRRDSAITEMVDGVYYTSDGRDIEMSVASTKAFYSQVAAGLVISLRLAHLLGTRSPDRIGRSLSELKQLPRLMRRVLRRGDDIDQAARHAAPTRRHWAVVGSGPNFVAAQEVRIKLSELCYKSIACDVIEDKKHIDLSSEPLVIVLAAGNPESVLGDLVKDVAIFNAHKACPIVFASDEAEAFRPYAESLIELPETDRVLSVVLNTLAGHLWGYHAARAIEHTAVFLAGVRSFLVGQLTEASDLYALIYQPTFRRQLVEMETEFIQRLRRGEFNAALSTDVGAELALLFSYLSGRADLAGFQVAFDAPPTPEGLTSLFLTVISRAIDELSRPIDAIKHQAKTVTVGTSRHEELPRGVLFDAAGQVGVKLHDIQYQDLAELKRLQAAVACVTGMIHYRITGLPVDGVPVEQTLIEPVERHGLSAQLQTRTAGGVPIQGTKRTIVRTRKIYVGIGRGDSRQILIVPLYSADQLVEGLLLCHLEFVESLDIEQKIHVLGVRYEDLKNSVIEANRQWDDQLLGALSPQDLLIRRVEQLAESLGSG